MVRATNGFNTYTDARLLAKANYIFARMTNNADCPDPVPALTVLADLIKQYNEALTAAGTRSLPAIAFKNAKKAELVDVMRQIANYVTLCANGSVDIIVGAGYEASKARTTPEPLQMPGAPAVLSGAKPGSLVLTTSPQPALVMNRFFVSEDPLLPLEQWLHCYNAKNRQEFTELKSATRYYAKVQQIGRTTYVESPVSTYVTQ